MDDRRPCFKDDFLSLIYVLSYIHVGDLPWGINTRETHHNIQTLKNTLKADKFFPGLPEQYEILFNYVECISPIDKINYDYLIDLFQSAPSLLTRRNIPPPPLEPLVCDKKRRKALEEYKKSQQSKLMLSDSMFINS